MKIAEDNEFRNIAKLLSSNKSLLEKLKLCMNLKTDYRPVDKSIKKPIIFVTLFLAFLAARLYLLNPGL